MVLSCGGLPGPCCCMQTQVSMLFEGPVGEPTVDINSGSYKSVLLISGGIGITPMQVGDMPPVPCGSRVQGGGSTTRHGRRRKARLGRYALC